MSALTSLEHTGNTDHKIGQELQNVDADLLKGRLDDLEGGGGAGPEDHAGDVEAHLGEAARRRPLAEPPGGQAPEPALLLPVTASAGIPKPVPVRVLTSQKTMQRSRVP